MNNNDFFDVALSKKQKDFLTSGFARINLLDGSVRSGKTWISIVAWAFHVAAMPKGCEFLMVGRTLTTLSRNCLGLLQSLEPSFKYSISQKKATLFGKTVWLEGANDEQAESKIRGMTLAGVYIDELTLIPRNFYYMCLSRLSIANAKLFATTNPDSPVNYVFAEIIRNNSIDKKITSFRIDDNPFLDPEYVQNLKREYSGVFYQRYLLGEWVIAEGLVYPMYNNTVVAEDREYEEFYVSMDYGIMNPTAMLLWGRVGKTWYCIKEYYHSGRETQRQKTDGQYYEDLERLCAGRKITKVIVDPSASSFIALIRQKGRFSVLPADNTVIEGIQHVASALADQKILFNSCCKMTIQEFALYSWDAKSNVDAPIKENDHAMDAVRYFVQTKRLFRVQGDYRSILETR